MSQFNFEKEMVLGKKHLSKLNCNLENCNIADVVQRHFGYNLDKGHQMEREKYDLFTEIGKDSHTVYHRKFYQKIDEGWEEFSHAYDNFVQKIILPYLGLEEALVQKFPSFRVQLPNNVAVVVDHYDSDENHHHPFGEINFIYALTDMFDTNTVYVEKMPRSKNYLPILLKRGECISFNGNLCSHHNKINKTGVTRMSFDFRIMPLNYYQENYNSLSVTKKMKYVDGGYYKRVRIPPVPVRDVWDREKTRFHHIMDKVLCFRCLGCGRLI